MGPPAYGATPTWGFPALAWRWPKAVPSAVTEQPVTVERVRAVAGHAAAMMWALAALAVFAAAGEVWRYVLLVRSRTGALSSSVVSASDAVVTIAAVLAVAFGVVAVVVTLWWLRLARHAAADLADQRLARPDWQVILYLLIPGVNLAMAGVVLAELEHQVLRRPAHERPRPTKPVVIWWSVWAAAGLLFGLTVVWRFRDSAQAHADGVILSGLTDLAAAAVAILTALMVRRLAAFLAPIDPATVRHLRVLRIEGVQEALVRVEKPATSRR
ncbi:uncharacterized protein DUF4328 [Actinophytocola oryzae]|uniref:Uncharacterized protein DUF4328 n=2 Tax=Actinophytocola oryzae TaxID=502181 RepID=A0A4R7VMR9_9PSEU|nr:uncharacterized protein DUF4328 [Actinophytocola oryzae]